MATGSGKTVVMSMLIAWQVLNKRRHPQDKRFTDAFLVVAPGITIRDRLRVLLPSDPNNYYRELDIVPADYRDDLGTAKIVITNFHAFKHREKGDAGGLTKRILTARSPGAFTESPAEMVNRVCDVLGKHREIIVINDEAHHCYRGKPAETKEKMTREEAAEAKARDEEARLWITGLEAVHKKIGVKAVYDLSATPFYLKGSGYPEGTLFPWVVSDFSLIDAIECGIVKVPRVPVADNAMTGDYPKYRNLWADIREGLKNVRRGPEDAHKPPLLPGLLEGPSRAFTATTLASSPSGRPTRRDRPTAALRPCSSSCATIPTSVRPSLTSSPDTRRNTSTRTAIPSSPGARRCRCSTTSKTSAGTTSRTPSSWTADSWNPARACPTTSRR